MEKLILSRRSPLSSVSVLLILLIFNRIFETNCYFYYSTNPFINNSFNNNNNLNNNYHNNNNNNNVQCNLRSSRCYRQPKQFFRILPIISSTTTAAFPRFNSKIISRPIYTSTERPLRTTPTTTATTFIRRTTIPVTTISTPLLSSSSNRLRSPRPELMFDYRSFSIGYKQCSVNSYCQYYYECRFKESPDKPKFCSLDNGFTGVCCKQDKPNVNHRPLTNKTYNYDKIKFDFEKKIKNLENLENELARNQLYPKINTKEFLHQNFFGSNQLTFKEMTNAYKILESFIDFSKKENLSPDDIINNKWDIRDTYLKNLCEPIANCNNKLSSRYRTYDGTCNNLLIPNQGKSISTFSRLLPPDYGDRINSPRKSSKNKDYYGYSYSGFVYDGDELPNSRLISLSITPEKFLPNQFYSLLLMQFGQFVAHDLTRSAITRTHDNMRIDCCDQKILNNPNLKHPACFPIPVPNEDRFLLGQGQNCINFVRTAPAINPRCRFGPREQLNQLSSYLDCNNIYGTSEKEILRLRMFQNGLLKISWINDKAFLPNKPKNDAEINCQIPNSTFSHGGGTFCFLGGDIRANENLDLTILHTIWLREHNRIALELKQINPQWNDEILFQETRRIVIAEYQHIIFNEFLPYIIGPKSMDHFNLRLIPNGYSQQYNPAVDSTIMNEFAVAAFRLHSIVSGQLNLLNLHDNRISGQILLRNTFSNPSIIFQDGIYDMRINGLTGQSIQNFDNFFTQDVTNHLFQVPGKNFGLDLVALNIQRGRDHGIQGYIYYREMCGLSKINSFDDLKSIFSNQAIADILKILYKNILEDIDLFVAGTSEKPLPGALVGPTFACIIGEQFRRIKQGDRFWFENGPLGSSATAGGNNNNVIGIDEAIFTPGQLAELRKTSFARILCDASDITAMQPYPLLMPSDQNPKMDCNQLPIVDLNQWRYQ